MKLHLASLVLLLKLSEASQINSLLPFIDSHAVLSKSQRELINGEKTRYLQTEEYPDETTYHLIEAMRALNDSATFDYYEVIRSYLEAIYMEEDPGLRQEIIQTLRDELTHREDIKAKDLLGDIVENEPEIAALVDEVLGISALRMLLEDNLTYDYCDLDEVQEVMKQVVNVDDPIYVFAMLLWPQEKPNEALEYICGVPGEKQLCYLAAGTLYESKGDYELDILQETLTAIANHGCDDKDWCQHQAEIGISKFLQKRDITEIPLHKMPSEFFSLLSIARTQPENLGTSKMLLCAAEMARSHQTDYGQSDYPQCRMALAQMLITQTPDVVLSHLHQCSELIPETYFARISDIIGDLIEHSRD